MKVPFLNLNRLHHEISDELKHSFSDILTKGQFIGGEYLDTFEKSYSAYTGSDYCVGVGNGLDALVICLKALDVGPGDEVIVPSNTFIATWLAVTHCGATIVPVEPDIRTHNIDVSLIEERITEKTRVIIPVHLYGQPANLDEIIQLASKYKLYVIEDAAQAHGASYKGKKIGSHGDLVAWSHYPGKNLGALGDAGSITTNNKELANKVRLIGNYGSNERYIHELPGINSRMDPIQASVLSIKLNYLDIWNERRREIAETYLNELKDLDITLPFIEEFNLSVWHLFCIRSSQRDKLRKVLLDRGVETLIHYPTPPYAQEAYEYLGWDQKKFPLSSRISNQLVSLPLCPSMSDDQVEHVIDSVNSFVF